MVTFFHIRYNHIGLFGIIVQTACAVKCNVKIIAIAVLRPYAINIKGAVCILSGIGVRKDQALFSRLRNGYRISNLLSYLAEVEYRILIKEKAESFFS